MYTPPFGGRRDSTAPLIMFAGGDVTFELSRETGFNVEGDKSRSSVGPHY